MWTSVSYEEGTLIGYPLPPDGEWVLWKLKNGEIRLARLKYDIIDHFYPNTDFREEDIVAWKFA